MRLSPPIFTKNNYEVWLIDYPGFGKTTGECTEETMYADADQFYKMARSRFSKDSIFFMESRLVRCGRRSWLLSKIVKDLSWKHRTNSMEALMNTYVFIYPVGLLSKYHFPTYRYFEKIEVPITIFMAPLTG